MIRSALFSIIFLLLAFEQANANVDVGIQALSRGDFQTAYQNLSVAAQGGNAEAQFRMCGMYFLGQGVPKNDVEAFQWCKLAADQGHIEAAYNTALFYQKGNGVGPNISQAANYYKKAAEAGHKDAQFNLLQLYNANALASAAGSAGGLKQIDRFGNPQAVGIVPPLGVPLDANGNAVSYLPPAAPQPATTAGAVQVAQSSAVPAPLPQSVQQQIAQLPLANPPAPTAAPTAPPAPPIKLTAAEQRNYNMQAACLAASQQGILPENCAQTAGLQEQQVAAVAPKAVATVKPQEDLQNTIGWFEKQAELGDVAAQNNLGVIYRRGTGVEKQPKKAMELFEKSAARGSVNGMLNLANMHKLGEGTEQNLEISYAWYNLAADRLPAGEKKKKALENIKEISAFMNNQQIGSALEYLTQLDSSIPLLEGEE